MAWHSSLSGSMASSVSSTFTGSFSCTFSRLLAEPALKGRSSHMAICPFFCCFCWLFLRLARTKDCFHPELL